MGIFYLVNKSKVNRRSSEKRNVKQQSRSAVHDEDEPDISEGNESYLEGKIWSPSQMFVLCYKPNEHLCRRYLM